MRTYFSMYNCDKNYKLLRDNSNIKYREKSLAILLKHTKKFNSKGLPYFWKGNFISQKSQFS